MLHTGGTVVLSAHGAPDLALRLIERHRVTHVALVPPLAHVWLASPLLDDHDLTSLALVQVGGAKLGTSAAERMLTTFGDTLQQVFGMAEGLVCYTRTDDPRHLVTGTQGRPSLPPSPRGGRLCSTRPPARRPSPSSTSGGRTCAPRACAP